MTLEAEQLRKQNIKIIRNAVITVAYCRKQQYFYAMQHSNQTIRLLMKGMELLLQMLPLVNGENPFSSVESITEMLKALQNAQEEEDYVLLADLLEASLIPMLSTCQQRLIDGEAVSIDEEMLRENVIVAEEKIPGITQMLFHYNLCDEYERSEKLSDCGFQAVIQAVEAVLRKGYTVEYTADGGYTVAIPGKNQKSYLHTNNMVAQESFDLAAEWLAQGDSEYLFYGIGLGYPYQRMLSMDENICITVVEGNLNILLLALVFAPVSLLLQNERFHLELDITNRRLFDLVKEKPEAGCYIHFPSLKGIRNQKYRQRLEEYFVSESSYRTQQRKLDGNFKKNQIIKAENVWNLKEKFSGKDLYIIAAGPSLDGNLQQLSRVVGSNDSIILATGTVLKKLLAAEISPDYVIVTDAGRGVYAQLEGVVGDIPLLFLSTANSKAVASYAGCKYQIYQTGYPLAEQAAEQEGASCFETGGSVSTTAMEIGIQLNCKRIIFLGLDLAYTDGKSHAQSTENVQNIAGMTTYTVEAVDGTMVETARNWNIYRQWMENRILQMRQKGDKRPVIDATEGGAKKAGMMIMPLTDVIEN